MNKRAFIDIDEIDPINIGFAFISGLVMWGMLSYWNKTGAFQTGFITQIIMSALAFIGLLTYLQLTGN